MSGQAGRDRAGHSGQAGRDRAGHSGQAGRDRAGKCSILSTKVGKAIN